VIPTHQPMIREDRMDQVYQTSRERYAAVIKDIKDCQSRGQPTLVGTTSIENSELISKMLDKEKLPHNVLNAKQHAREAEIVAQAEKRASQMVEEAKNAARDEGNREKAAAKAEIEQEISRAREALRLQVAALAVSGAEKILRREVDAKTHADLLQAVQAEL